MSARTRVTQGFRVKAVDTDGEWVVARHAKTERMVRDSATGYISGGSGRKGANARVEEPALIHDLVAAGKLTAEKTNVLIVSALDPRTLDKAAALIELMGDRLDDLEDADMERLISAAMPVLSDQPQPAAIDQARRNAKARTEFIRHYEVLDAEQVHAVFGSSAKNKAALAARWRSEGRIFALEHKGRLLYPAFQFDSQGKPKKMLAAVLVALGPSVGPWQTALWFTSANGWLGGRNPLDLLATETDLVVEAASAVAEPADY